ncbi:hypothetical protein LSH36_78g04014 [Paralvinella palmiformis]|uniref:Neurotransmitter-gated ion-channel ligand-binding domain-containing protein n=1 Tax=Paralvinella palmiformis TaxID=53620 RepID=A0AAD9K2F7_9ANNE|nr:hypothetical protein LSH36_78g04014 [Paralvinella palmiformis]
MIEEVRQTNSIPRQIPSSVLPDPDTHKYTAGYKCEPAINTCYGTHLLPTVMPHPVQYRKLPGSSCIVGMYLWGSSCIVGMYLWGSSCIVGMHLYGSSCIVGSSLNARLPSDEERLLELLFDGYNPSARPVINSSHTVDVRMQFSLLQIQELNLRNQVLTTTGLLILEWRDERLKWDSKAIPLTDVVVEASKLWRPEFASINGADGIYGDYGQFRAIISNTGDIHWEPGGVFKTVCEIDITYYPFDEQHCLLIFGAWSYHTNKMNITTKDDVVNMDSYEGNGEWEIYDTAVNSLVKLNSFCWHKHTITWNATVSIVAATVAIVAATVDVVATNVAVVTAAVSIVAATVAIVAATVAIVAATVDIVAAAVSIVAATVAIVAATVS